MTTDVFQFEQAAGHLIRRAHQVSVATFMDETADFGATPVQFAILTRLLKAPGTDQISLASSVAHDAATIGSVIARLERRGWLRREPDAADRRRKLLWLTPEGEAVANAMVPCVKRVQERILAPLNVDERSQLLLLLTKLAET
ncbi:MarR family transcriptional regulator [Ottowia sp.]|uniref:MarR family winged helix-turn-helix transcriptional regulator n=1 Tax=Ottowia sp. TaxID=1898956 RepID=UPI00260D24BB|nr:MarR family transcriptional regulator [Ottowia sp.]